MGRVVRGRWVERLMLAEHLVEEQLRKERLCEGPRHYPPDLMTDVAMLDEIFEIQSQRAFKLMRQCGVALPERDPEARRRRG